jgi:hypothetical protein
MTHYSLTLFVHLFTGFLTLAASGDDFNFARVAIPFPFLESLPSNALDDPNTDFTEVRGSSSRAELAKSKCAHPSKGLADTLDHTPVPDNWHVNQYGSCSLNQPICLAALFPPLRC